MSSLESDDDRPLSPSEVRARIRRMLADVAVPVARAAGRPGSPSPRPSAGRARTIPRSRYAIPGFDPTDPKLAEVLAELDAKRAEAQAHRVDAQVAVTVEGGDL
jgi:hypothetical protein